MNDDKLLITTKMEQNAHKVTYLVEQYPEHNLDQIISMFQMPSIDINIALWIAIERGWLSKPDPETKMMQLLGKPDEWDFGDNVIEMEAKLVYAFAQINKKETDLEENGLSSWTHGYPSHDTIIVMRRLLEGKVLSEYTINDVQKDENGKQYDNVYTFYTLYENRDHKWGRKQFKVDPLAEPEVESSDASESKAE